MEAYAVVETGGKQYRVEKGDLLKIESIGTEAGQQTKLEKVLALSDGKELKVGAPELTGASVTAEVVRHLRGKKIVAFKKKRRKGYHKKIGHRQELTEIKIVDFGA
ncbi:MAG TPA: 50S ribosomal protein L21 [Verrucomicrobia bacterium]|nr:50S ribosomal protein L21 [Verrucomicrobiota bacterium]